MKNLGSGWVKSMLVALSAGLGASSYATLYCNRSYDELAEGAARPFNAVGFLNNGCTAFLIDENHIAAAAHCFVDTTTGAWQHPLRFYPNFHPDRVTAAPAHNPRADVDRAIVGSRVGSNGLGVGMDWGIAHLTNWQDTAGIDLTPVALANSVPQPGSALQNPAYTRHHFPFNDHDVVTWDNMTFDTTDCGWVGQTPTTPGGMWAVVKHDAPIFDGANRDPGLIACNTRWAAGYVHGNCSLKQNAADVVIENCDTVGGSSGSPLLAKDAGGAWGVIGVVHGGGPTDFDSSTEATREAPQCTQDTVAREDNGGPSVDRFRDAPRFATAVAIHRDPGNPASTAVFAIDGDRNVVVYRSRLGSAPTYSSKFGYWRSLGAPLPAVIAHARLQKIAACASSSQGKPELFVTTSDGAMYSRDTVSGIWNPVWSSTSIPESIGGVVDVDATTDPDGRCLLLATGAHGGVFARAKASDSTWSGWSTVAAGSFTAVTGLRYAGVTWAAMIDAAGEIWRTSLSSAGWAAPTKLSRPPGVAAWLDIDLTWDEAARGFMVAIPTTGGNALFFTPLYGDNPWGEWRTFDTRLWAPDATTRPDAPRFQSITASRWMEDPAGTTSPVVFGTDDAGNVYFIEFARVGPSAPGWVLDWKSFYHESIVYP